VISLTGNSASPESCVTSFGTSGMHFVASLFLLPVCNMYYLYFSVFAAP
jgi:hypothetical protein